MMKLSTGSSSIRSGLALLSLVSALGATSIVGCSEDDSSKLGKPGATGPTTPPPVAAPTATTRKLVAGSALTTSATNLLGDPGFSLVGQDSAFFLAFYENGTDQAELGARYDSRSPAGFAGNVGIVKAFDAKDTSSSPILVISSFVGGPGPFRARVWVSKSTPSGEPADVTIDGAGIRASITEDLSDGAVIELAPVPEQTRVAAGRTWTLLEGNITQPLTYGGFFMINAGTGGGQFLVASPEVVAQPLVDGLAAVKSVSKTAALKTRARTTSERAIIQKYKSRPPRLQPVTPSVRRGE